MSTKNKNQDIYKIANKTFVTNTSHTKSTYFLLLQAAVLYSRHIMRRLQPGCIHFPRHNNAGANTFNFRIWDQLKRVGR